MKYRELDRPSQEAINRHAMGIMAITGEERVMILVAANDSEMVSEMTRTLRGDFGRQVYDPQTHRAVAIMAADREPGDAAKAVEDVMTIDPRAGGVFDAVGAAFATLAAGEHADLTISINRDRVTMDQYSPPRPGETVLGTLKSFDPAMPGQTISAVATGIETRPIAKYAIDQQVYERVGVGYRRVVVTGIFHYRNSATSYQVEDLDPHGEHRQRVWEENALFENVPE
jgi:hypothetical protein